MSLAGAVRKFAARGRLAVVGALFIGAMSVHAAASDAVVRAENELKAGETTRAIDTLTQAADTGDAEAQLLLGRMLEEGEAVLRDYSAAAKWYDAAAGAGNTDAMNRLARLYASGLGVGKDLEKAFDLYRKAAGSGDPQYVFDLAVMYDNGLGVEANKARAAALYKSAAVFDHVGAIANLGVLYHDGAGVKQDFSRAMELFTRAAEKGNARAQNNLGLMYSRGEGTPQDYARAASWFQKAADQGLAVAITNLGVMYENGFGVPLDEARAEKLYRQGGLLRDPSQMLPNDAIPVLYDPRLAAPPADTAELARTRADAEGGDPVAQFVMGYLSAAGLAGKPDFRAAARWFRLAADKGMTSAMSNLGLMYFRGRGVPQDYVTGYMWLELGANTAELSQIREMLALKMTPEQINEAQKRASDHAGERARP